MNKNIFGIKQVKYRNLGLPEELVTIFRKQKNYRTPKDNIFLIKSCDNLKCFQKLIKSNKQGDLMYETIIKNLDFVINEPGKVIYYPKDMITNMFYIFHGSIKVDRNQYDRYSSPKKKISKSRKKYYSNTKDDNNNNNENNDNEKFDEEKSSDKKNISEMNRNIEKKNVQYLGFYKKLLESFQKIKKKKYKSKEKDIDKDKENKTHNDDIIFNNSDGIEYLKKGDEYGAEDIYSTRRRDLVECKTYCVIGFLSKHDWIYIFEKTDILKKNDLLTFLKSSKILKEVNNEVVINNIYNSIKEKRLFRGETLVKNGDYLDRIYIIRKGFFQVNLNIKQKIKNLFNDLNYFGNFNMKEKSENIKYELKNYYYKNEKYKIVTYGEGEIIGDIETFLGRNYFLTDIFCNTDSSLVYEISFTDFNLYSNKTMKEALNREGKQKLDYFRERIRSIKTINSKKLNNANKFKEIISNKLEEEKGQIFNKMENRKNDKLKYEKKQRKKLKTSFVNFKLKKLVDQLSLQQCTGINLNLNNKYYTYKNNSEKHNKYRIKYKNKIKEEFEMFHTSIKNTDFILMQSTEFLTKDVREKIENQDNEENQDNIDKSINNLETNYSQYVKTKNSNSINYNSIKKMFKSKDKIINNEKNNKKISSGNLKNFKHFNSNLGNKQNNIIKIHSKDYLSLRNESLVNCLNNINILSSNNTKPSINDKFHSIFTCLFQQSKRKNISNEEYDSLNYYHTQESNTKKNLDTSKQNFIKNPQYQQYSINIWSPKIETPRKTMPLLTEIIKDKKEILFKRLSTGKNRNYNIKEKIFNK